MCVRERWKWASIINLLPEVPASVVLIDRPSLEVFHASTIDNSGILKKWQVLGPAVLILTQHSHRAY